MKIKDKIAIVTGSSRGIGRSIALALAQEGAHIVVTATEKETAEMTADKIRIMKRQALALKVDVRKTGAIHDMFRKTLDRFGRIDILVNNAGVGAATPIIKLTLEEWNRVMDINARSVFLCSQYAIKEMIKQGDGGKIINIASMAAKTGMPFAAHYSASKFAVIGFTQALAKEMGKYQININAVCPGFIRTRMYDKWDIDWISNHEGIPKDKVEQRIIHETPLGRILPPDDVAKLVVFLASSDSNSITGQALNITGGIEVH